MAAIYEKALKRKDFSGATALKTADAEISKTKTPPELSSTHSRSSSSTSSKGKGSSAPAKPADGADAPQSSADVGKIVQLMSAGMF